MAGEISEGWSKRSEGHNFNLQQTKLEMERISGECTCLEGTDFVCLGVCVCVSALIIGCGPEGVQWS